MKLTTPQHMFELEMQRLIRDAEFERYKHQLREEPRVEDEDETERCIQRGED